MKKDNKVVHINLKSQKDLIWKVKSWYRRFNFRKYRYCLEIKVTFHWR